MSAIAPSLQSWKSTSLCRTVRFGVDEKMTQSHSTVLERWHRLQMIVVVLVVAYAIVYVTWTRCARFYWQSFNTDGYFFLPVVPQGRMMILETAVKCVFWPCILIDVYLGGPSPGSSQPLMDLSQSFYQQIPPMTFVDFSHRDVKFLNCHGESSSCFC